MDNIICRAFRIRREGSAACACRFVVGIDCPGGSEYEREGEGRRKGRGAIGSDTRGEKEVGGSNIGDEGHVGWVVQRGGGHIAREGVDRRSENVYRLYIKKIELFVNKSKLKNDE